MKLKNKKRAFAFVQSLIVFMFIILIVSISINLINYNYLKSKTFNSYSDKKTLTIEEELILKEINKSKNYSYDDGQYKLIMKRNSYYLIKKSTNSNKYYELEIKEYNSERILIPTYYKTKNIIGD
ncbi:hypothetical protein R0131_17085, partial [Clostridium sp. AL.422]|uniref:hypothetical protein n=1 Tax=Clostridium TaxID=1485 RepID=UPI00293DA75C